MCNGNSASSWSYDAMGRTLLEKRANHSPSLTKTYSIGYAYFQDGSLKALTYPSGDVVTYTLGGARRVTQVADSGFGIYFTSATYAPFGGLTGAKNNCCSSVHVAIENSYNSRLQPNLLSAFLESNTTSVPIIWLSYDFHPAQPSGDNGNVFGLLDSIDSTHSAAFQFDPLNRLSQGKTLTATGSNCWGEVYTIDPWGNLTNRAGVSGMTGCSTEPLNAPASVKNQLSGISYDAAGNVINDGLGNTPTYNAENRIITDAGVTYSYDADEIRMEKSSGTMNWPGPSGEVLTETDLSGNINEEYVYFNGKRIARVDRPSGTVHYYFSDLLGSASVITDASGNVQERYYYYPYGGLFSSIGSDPNHYKFTGKERDVESTLDYFGARHYASTMGRFITPDQAADETIPVPLPYADFRNPQTLNPYSYALNNPGSNVDPDGHDVHICIDNYTGGQICFNLNDLQYADLYKQQNGQQGINLPGGAMPNGNITCGGQICGSAEFFEPGGRDDSMLQALNIGLAAKGVGALIEGGVGFIRAGIEGLGGPFGREAGVAAGGKILVSGSKAAIRDALESGAVKEVQKQAVKRALARGAAADSYTVEKLADGSIRITREVAGRAGGLATYESVVDAAGNTMPGSAVQKAYDAAGNLVHYDPKN